MLRQIQLSCYFIVPVKICLFNAKQQNPWFLAIIIIAVLQGLAEDLKWIWPSHLYQQPGRWSTCEGMDTPGLGGKGAVDAAQGAYVASTKYQLDLLLVCHRRDSRSSSHCPLSPCLLFFISIFPSILYIPFVRCCAASFINPPECVPPS
jgi:hypothetical protein